MKKIFYLLLLIAAPASSQTTWQLLNSGTSGNIRDIYFATREIGYAVGEDSLIIKTTDGGDTWFPLQFPDTGDVVSNGGNLESIAFISENNGLLAFRFSNGIVQTSDGGGDWDMMPTVGQICFGSSLLYPSQSEGYFVGRGCFGGAMISTYSGFGWSAPTMVYYGPNQGGLNGIAKDSATNRMVAVGDDGLITWSDDSFINFDTVIRPDSLHLMSVDATGNNGFVAVNKAYFNPVLISTDGGETFFPDSTFPATFFYPMFEEVDYYGADWGVAAGESNMTSGVICLKKGVNWDFFPTPHPLHTVFVVDSNLAFAAGDSGQIYRYQKTEGTGIGTFENAPGITIQPTLVSMEGTLTLLNPEGLEIRNISVMDINGRHLGSFEPGMQQLGVQRFTQAAGLYLVRISTSKGEKTIRILVH